MSEDLRVATDSLGGLEMHDLKEECRQLRHMIDALYDVVKKLAEHTQKDKDIQDGLEGLETSMKKWHVFRTTRFDQEIKDAEAVLTKTSQLGDYGADWGTGKFIVNPRAVSTPESPEDTRHLPPSYLTEGEINMFPDIKALRRGDEPVPRYVLYAKTKLPITKEDEDWARRIIASTSTPW